ncbi:MIZ/SP-RING zinc finger-domain-containing protein [Cunninghamella echinulata]|nr:MIZ/SP-RING zinc finger-domain-containing protein [Cunninghamella echinulata]
MYKTQFIIHPFRLRHNQRITDTKLFIGELEYNRLTASLDTRTNPPNFYPIKYIFTSWKKGTPDTKCDWSEHIRFFVNNKEAKLERKKKVSNMNGGIAYVGKDKPFDLFSHLKPGNNVLTIHQEACACDYFFCVTSYTCQSEYTIIRDIQNRISGISDGERCVHKLLSIGDKKLSDDDDDIHIIQQSVKLNLKCPISFTPIKIPVKGEDCRHPDCFDLCSYLAVNQDLATWKCPHCNFFVPPTKLKRDLYFENLLKTVPKFASEVTMTKECPEWKVTNSDFPDDDLDDSDDEDNGVKNKPVTKIEKTSYEVISLISDDEEEEEEEKEKDSNIRNKKPRINEPAAVSNTSVNNESTGIATATSTTNSLNNNTSSGLLTSSSSPMSTSALNIDTNNDGSCLAPELLNIFEKIFHNIPL